MKRILAILLALIMILCSLVACDQTQDDTNEEESSSTQAATNNNNTTEPETDPVKIGNLDPSINLNEKEINIISSSLVWMKDEVSVETENADPINDAIYKRNKDVEKALNVKIKNTLMPVSSMSDDYVIIDELKKTNGPDCPYHLASNNAYTSFENTHNGYFRNLLDVEHLDLSQDYWAPYYNAGATIGNQQYFATGSISLSLRRFIFVTFFNKDLANYYNLENLYDVVNEGRWTLDYQAKIISNMFTEVDNQSGATEGDTYGFLTDNGIYVDAYIASCDIEILVKDSDDFFVLQPNKEKADSMMQKIYNLYWKSGATYVFQRNASYAQFDKIRDKFSSGEATMITDRLIGAESEQLKNMDSPYGILPIPKFDDAQKEYYSLAHDLFTVYGIVNSEATDKMTSDLGAVLECLAIESERTVKDAYFEVALKGKYSKDAESWEMLDMIIKNLKINGGLLYTIKLTDITHQFRTAVGNKLRNTETIFNTQKQATINIYLKKMQDEIRKLQNG